MSDYKEYFPSLILGIILFWLINKLTNTIRGVGNTVPGPKSAKISIFWKFTNIHRGTYISKLRQFHKYAAVVQVGPREYSIGNPLLLRPPLLKCEGKLEKIEPYKLLISPHTTQRLHAALQMANIFHYEPLLEKCNRALLRALVGHAENEEEFNLSDLLARYAYGMMFCTTTGSAPGFLERKQDISSLSQAISTWKFYAVLYGSYLRFLPIARQGLRWFGTGRALRKAVAKHVAPDHTHDGACIANELHHDSSSSEEPISFEESTVEAIVALLASGADPVITHLLASIYFTYQDVELVDALRNEIDRAHLGEPPKLKSLIHAKTQMPLLHAVLQESLRVINTSASSYVAPKGGVKIAGADIPEECTICCEPTIAHVNPNIFGRSADIFDPSRWLEDPSVARSFRNHMIAFGAGTDPCPGKELHLSIVAKVFTQIVTSFDFKMASVSTLQVPNNLAFDQLKGLTVAKVVLPKGTKSVSTVLSSPLRATAPAFAPETTTGPELPPGFTPKELFFDHDDSAVNGYYTAVGDYAAPVGGQSEPITNDATEGDGGSSMSPALSVATTTKSSEISVTPLTWSDQQTLEDLIGNKLTHRLINEFDPASDLTSRTYLKTGPLHESRKRYLLHDVIERVWNGTLIHETSRRDNCMYIWVPGARLPAWLQNLHRNRHANDRKNTSEQQATSSTATANHRSAHSATASRPANIWTNFAQDENTRYTTIAAMTGDEYAAAERKKAEERGEKEADGGNRGITFKETFKQTGTNGNRASPVLTPDSEAASPDVDENHKPEPKRAVMPPHLRAKAASPPLVRNDSVGMDGIDERSKANDTKNNDDEGEWCAAKLPSPCSSD